MVNQCCLHWLQGWIIWQLLTALLSMFFIVTAMVTLCNVWDEESLCYKVCLENPIRDSGSSALWLSVNFIRDYPLFNILCRFLFVVVMHLSNSNKTHEVFICF